MKTTPMTMLLAMLAGPRLCTVRPHLSSRFGPARPLYFREDFELLYSSIGRV